ncbi:MAG: hypothetical protein RR357_06130 [Clostridia bacterium]
MQINYDSEAVCAFVAQCDELMNTKLIMSNQKIRMLLKCMAYYDDLREVVDDCKYNFDYDEEYSRAIVNLGTATVFRLPNSMRKKVALVVCLLLDFDEPRRNFVQFLQDFFNSEDRNEAYGSFCKNIIAPFKEAVLFLMSDEGKNSNTEEKDSKKREVNVAISEQTDYYIRTAIEATNSSKLDEAERKDIIFMLDNLKTILDLRDAQLIKAYWLGLKNTLQYNKLFNKNAQGLEEVLKAYLVL